MAIYFVVKTTDICARVMYNIIIATSPIIIERNNIMIRKIIRIDEEKCNGCGACANACHEGAIGMVNGKAKLLRDDFCDGLGNCLPACPTNAISFEMREAAEYNEAAVMAAKAPKPLPCGCPGTAAKSFAHKKPDLGTAENFGEIESRLNQWPVQIKLAPVNAPYFAGSSLLVAADCSAYAYGDFHRHFMNEKITLIGCPKLDGCDYTEKLTAVAVSGGVSDITVVRMEVPCCGGIELAAKKAAQAAGVPFRCVTISTDGRIL